MRKITDLLAQTHKKGTYLKIKQGSVSIKFIKKGTLVESEANELLIVDENKTAYKADQIVITIWSMCDGTRTQEQVVDDLAKEVKIEKTEINKAVSDILARLEQAGLVQKM